MNIEGTRSPQNTVWWALGACALVFAVMYFVLGYASGYGQVEEGKVAFIRHPLWQDMRLDYRRDGGEWGFGLFVPIAVLGLFWYRRKDLLATPVRPAMVAGGLVLAFGFLLYWAGYRGEQKYFGYAAGQILVMGAILWFLGWAWYRKVFWLWVLLGMMWPWRFLIGRISSPLQLVMAKLTAGALKLFGVEAVSNGSAVHTDTMDPVTGAFISMDIDVACSGMRSLFSLIMIGLIFAFAQVKEEWKRWVLMACVPFVAIAGNFVRMLILYGGSRTWGTEFSIGPENKMSGFHMFAGLMVFVVGLLLLSALVEVLNQGSRYFRRSKVVRKQVVSQVD